MKLPPAAVAVVLTLGLWGVARTAEAHFQVLLPDRDIVATADVDKPLRIDLSFTHPMEQSPVMEMGQPRQFGVLVGGKKRDLRESLKPRKIDGKTAFTCSLPVDYPGDYVFYLEPSPYWEPAEQKMIVHYTKVVVDVLGAENGWDAMVGLPVEIQPLARPYGLWTGNTFRGVVMRQGKPVAGARVEVEYYNEGRRVRIPADAFVTQVVKTDANGVFSYTMPRAGWWGFAALLSGEKMKGPDGKPVDVELGGLIWVKTVDMQSK
jgi:cobalt/nickel transport protein